MSAIRTPKNSTKKIIVINQRGQVVNIAKRWGVVGDKYGSIWGSYYFKKDAEQAARHMSAWMGFEPYVKPIDYSRIAEKDGELKAGWLHVSDCSQPHKTMKRINELLAQL